MSEETWEERLALIDLIQLSDDLIAESQAFRRTVEKQQGDVMLDACSVWGLSRRVPYLQLRREKHRMDELFKLLGIQILVDEWEKIARRILAKRSRRRPAISKSPGVDV